MEIPSFYFLRITRPFFILFTIFSITPQHSALCFSFAHMCGLKLSHIFVQSRPKFCHEIYLLFIYSFCYYFNWCLQSAIFFHPFHPSTYEVLIFFSSFFQFNFFILFSWLFFSTIHQAGSILFFLRGFRACLDQCNEQNHQLTLNVIRDK